MTDHHLWTFQIVGGRPFALQDHGNPVVLHDGGMSVFHQLLTDEQAERVRAVIDDHGCRTLAARRAEGQTASQRAERLRIQGAGRENEVWPTADCPNCFWFDAAGADPCGFTGWPSETVDEAVRRHPRAWAQMANCVIHGDGETHEQGET